MKILPIACLLSSLVIAVAAHSKSITETSVVDDGGAWTVYADLGISFQDLSAFRSHPKIRTRVSGQDFARDRDGPSPFRNGDSLADYETYVPHKTQPKISPFEKTILTAYLDDPRDVTLAKFLAAYHLNRSLLKKTAGRAVWHTILAQYFLNRALDLGGDCAWVRTALSRTDRKLDQLIARGSEHDDPAADAEEDHRAHKYFEQAFFDNHEEHRYRAIKMLLNDFVQHPNNMLTNTYLTTANIWVGGEAAYDDPTILYSFILSSYFSVRALTLAEIAEERWRENPSDHKRFRLATLIGGWTVPARRWLARLHGDDAAVASMDAEHRQWLEINPQFHSVPVGLMFFEEAEHFPEGLAAWEIGRKYCFDLTPLNLTCMDWPHTSFSVLSFVLGEVDFFLKAGMLEEAKALLSLRFIPIDVFAKSFELWDLGRAAWQHRENHLEEIAELYGNEDPSDDPSHFLLKRHQWGPGTFSCQVCHQRQGKVWPEGEIERVLSFADEFPPVGTGNWPKVSTTWYGASSASRSSGVPR